MSDFGVNDRDMGDTYMVSSLGTGMSGITLNDWDETQAVGKFSSYSNEDKAINASGAYDWQAMGEQAYMEPEEELEEIMGEYQRALTG